MKKPKPAPKRKRPRSVMTKAWVTRHAKMLLTPAAEPTGVKMPPPNKPASGKGRKTHRSESMTLTEAQNTLRAGPVEANDAPSKLEVLTEQLLATAKSNNRAEARPRVRHELANMLQTEHYSGLEDGIKYQKENTDTAVLCSLVASFHLGRRLDGARYMPSVIGTVTMRAVVELLESLGYTANGLNRKSTAI